MQKKLAQVLGGEEGGGGHIAEGVELLCYFPLKNLLNFLCFNSIQLYNLCHLVKFKRGLQFTSYTLFSRSLHKHVISYMLFVTC